MKTIPLTQGKVALVDDEDFERLSKYKWCALNCHGFYYAVRSERITNGRYGKTRHFKMHREILGLTDPKIHVDHKNHNGLDNRQENMRACTCSQNQMNQRTMRSKKHSPYKGVCFFHGKWRAAIKIKGKTTHLGTFPSEISAAWAYNEAAIKYFGEFAHVNP